MFTVYCIVLRLCAFLAFPQQGLFCIYSFKSEISWSLVTTTTTRQVTEEMSSNSCKNLHFNMWNCISCEALLLYVKKYFTQIVTKNVIEFFMLCQKYITKFPCFSELSCQIRDSDTGCSKFCCRLNLFEKSPLLPQIRQKC